MRGFQSIAVKAVLLQTVTILIIAGAFVLLTGLDRAGTLLFIAVIASAAGAVSLWLLLDGLVLKPIEKIKAGVERIGRGDIAYTFSEEEAGGVRPLAVSLNRMMIDLKRSEGEMQELIGHLDGKVERSERESSDYREKFMASQNLAFLGKIAELFTIEIDNPLLGIFTYIAVMKKKLAEGAEVDMNEMRREVDISAREIERASRITRSLFEFIGRPTKYYGKVNAAGTVEDALLILSNHLTIMNVSVEKRLSDAPAVMGDPIQFKKAFFIILYNAMKAMARPEKRRLSLTMEHDAKAGMVEIKFEHSGTAINPENIRSVFEPFHLPSKESAHEYGFGFALAKEIISYYGGSIELRLQQVDSATEIAVRLPAQKPV